MQKTCYDYGMLHKLKIVFLLLLLVVLIVFGLLNRDPTEIDLLFTRASLSTTLLVFLTAAIGFALGCLTTVLWMHRRTKRAKAKADALAAKKAATS